MRLVPRLRTKLQLLLLVESSFFMIGLAILFTLLSFVQPFGTFPVGGFWGSAEPSPGVTWSWGPGLGWWLLLVGVVLGVGGAVLPYLKSLRAMVPSATVLRSAP